MNFWEQYQMISSQLHPSRDGNELESGSGFGYPVFKPICFSFSFYLNDKRKLLKMRGKCIEKTSKEPPHTRGSTGIQ